MDLHPKQAQAYADPTRHQFVLAGRRGGKTVLIRERILRALNRAPDNGEVFYIGPTLHDATEIIWEPMLDRLEELGWPHKALISKRRIEFSRRRKLYVIGAEKIRRVRGHPLVLAALDEVAFYSTPLQDIWKAVRPALSDFGGRALITTTPNGKGTDAYDFYLEILKHPNEWAYRYWHTADNPHIASSEIESAKRDMDERSFRQEYEATWESFEGLAYYNFRENVHIKPCKELDTSLPLGIALDFNVNPTTLLVLQRAGENIRCRREYSFKNSSTLATIKAFCDDHKDWKERGPIHIHGDAAGFARGSQTGFSDYHYVKQQLEAAGFQFMMCVPGANPPIVDRVNRVNAWLRNARGEIRLTIDPGCSDTIRDLSSQQLDGRHPSPANNLGHKADALGYYIHWTQLMQMRGKQGTIQL